MALSPVPITQELHFLSEHTGEDELTLLSRALDLGLDLLYRQTAEEAFIDGRLAREEAVAILGHERIADLEYTKHALAEDIKRGLAL